MSSSTSKQTVLPIITIQHTFPEVLQEVNDGVVPYDTFWVSCYKESEPSVHSKIQAELDDLDRNKVNLSLKEGEAEMVKNDAGNYTIGCGPLDIPQTLVLTPVQNYIDVERSNPRRPHRITSFDVAPNCSRFATGFLDGSVLLYPTSPLPSTPSVLSQSVDVSNTKSTSRPHVSSVTKLRFFPSSRVLLSAGADFSLTILPADLPDHSTYTPVRLEPARTLRAHTRTVTSLGIIDVGRNIVSTSLDSTIKLWDVSSGSVISSSKLSSAVLSSSLGVGSSANGEPEELPTRDEREVTETQSYVAYLGLQNGAFNTFDFRVKKSVYSSTSSSSTSPLTSISYSDSRNLVATGSASGVINIYDSRAITDPIISFKRNTAGIEDLDFVSSQGSNRVGLAIATVDGLPYIASIESEKAGVAAELVGVECDPVRNVRVRTFNQNTEVWSASDDGVIRRYAV